MLQKLIDVQLGALWAQWGGGGERGGELCSEDFFCGEDFEHCQYSTS